MSGVVDTAKKAVTALAAPVIAPYKAAFNLVTHGTNPLSDLGDTAKKSAGAAMSVAGNPFLKAAGLKSDATVPNIAAEDPNAVEADAATKRAAAARQAQIDAQTQAPGRGGTILTDNYNYRT